MYSVSINTHFPECFKVPLVYHSWQLNSVTSRDFYDIYLDKIFFKELRASSSSSWEEDTIHSEKLSAEKIRVVDH